MTAFDYAAFRATFCAAKKRGDGLDNGFVADPDAPDWWKDPRLWKSPGAHASATEREGFSHIHEQARRARPDLVPKTPLDDVIEAVGGEVLREVFREEKGRRVAAKIAAHTAAWHAATQPPVDNSVALMEMTPSL